MKTTKDRLSEAFKAIRKHKIQARQNFSCCGSCGSYELAEAGKAKGKENYVFWHRQANEAFGGDGELERTLYLQHSLDEEAKKVVVEELMKAGLVVDWNWTDGKAIGIRRDEEMWQGAVDKVRGMLEKERSEKWTARGERDKARDEVRSLREENKKLREGLVTV